MDDEDWNKLLAVIPTSDENAQTFSSFILTDYNLEVWVKTLERMKNPKSQLKKFNLLNFQWINLLELMCWQPLITSSNFPKPVQS